MIKPGDLVRIKIHADGIFDLVDEFGKIGFVYKKYNIKSTKLQTLSEGKGGAWEVLTSNGKTSYYGDQLERIVLNNG